jgi:hypothetical protein
MSQILAAPETSRYVNRAIDPTTAVVNEKDWSDLMAALAELGLLAELSVFGDS